MFRVLTEEEARKAIRWQAPDLSGNAGSIAQTKQRVSPVKLGIHSVTNQSVAASLGGAVPGTHTSAPLLQAAHPLSATVQRHSDTTDSPVSSLHGVDGAYSVEPQRHGTELATTNLALQNPSADMLQASYDDGYARGYAEGNAALHQQSVKQLNDIIAALSAPGLRADDQLLEQELLALSLDITRVLLQREVQTQPDGMAQLVRAGIKQLPGASQGQTRIRLHPLDANSVREFMNDNPDVLVIDEPTLNRGECCIESGASQVHSGVEDWLTIMATELGILPDPDLQPA